YPANCARPGPNDDPDPPPSAPAHREPTRECARRCALRAYLPDRTSGPHTPTASRSAWAVRNQASPGPPDAGTSRSTNAHTRAAEVPRSVSDRLLPPTTAH